MAEDAVPGVEQDVGEVGTLQALRQHRLGLQVLVQVLGQVESLAHLLVDKVPDALGLFFLTCETGD